VDNGIEAKIMASVSVLKVWSCSTRLQAHGRIKVGAIDAATLGPFLKQARVRTDKVGFSVHAR